MFQAPRTDILVPEFAEGAILSINDVYVLDAIGAKPRRLFEGTSPALSPDGTRIAYCTRPKDYADQINIANTDGSGARTLVRMKGGACFPAWSPDGRRIAFSGDPTNLQPTNRFGPTQIFVMDADGSHITPIAEGAGVARWSPDGTQLLFCRLILRNSGPRQGTPNNRLSVWIASVDGSRLMRIPGLVLQRQWPGVAWLNEGSAIAYTSQDDKGRRVIKSVRLDGTGSILLVEAKGVDLFNPTLSPDGSQLFAEANPITTALNRSPYNEPTIVLLDLKNRTSIPIAQGLNPSILWQPQAQLAGGPPFPNQ